MTIVIRAFEKRDADAVVVLWREAGLTRPWNDPYADIERKLTVQPELFLVAEDARQLVGSVMAGYDGHRGWIYYLASAAHRQGEGIGRALVAEVEKRLLLMGCPKVQLMVRTDNAEAMGFYDHHGYEQFEVAMAGKRLIVDLSESAGAGQ